MIKIPGMLMVSAGGRNVGKTEFACSLIRKFSSRCNIIGIKVTAIEGQPMIKHIYDQLHRHFTMNDYWEFVRRENDITITV